MTSKIIFIMAVVYSSVSFGHVRDRDKSNINVQAYNCSLSIPYEHMPSIPSRVIFAEEGVGEAKKLYLNSLNIINRQHSEYFDIVHNRNSESPLTTSYVRAMDLNSEQIVCRLLNIKINLK